MRRGQVSRELPLAGDRGHGSGIGAVERHGAGDRAARWGMGKERL